MTETNLEVPIDRLPRKPDSETTIKEGGRTLRVRVYRFAPYRVLHYTILEGPLFMSTPRYTSKYKHKIEIEDTKTHLTITTQFAEEEKSLLT